MVFELITNLISTATAALGLIQLGLRKQLKHHFKTSLGVTGIGLVASIAGAGIGVASLFKGSSKVPLAWLVIVFCVTCAIGLAAT